MSHIQMPTNLSPSTVDIVHNTAEQQRRRNSSIAKLLGGQPLHNQQYEEINQQILDSQSVQNVPNPSDHGTDSSIQRTRSSITRTLLMNTERTNNITEVLTKTQVASTPPPFSKDFEYLIRREPDKSDTEHAPFILQQNTPKVCQNLNSSNKTNVPLTIQSKLKRKRSISKTSFISPNKLTTNIPPFSLHDPFELESSVINTIPSIHHQQNEFPHFNPSKRPRHLNQQQHNLSTSNSTTNQFSYPYDKMNMNSSVYNQFSIHNDRIPSNNGSRYSHSTKLILPSPIATLPSPGTELHHNRNNNNKSVTMTSIRKAKAIWFTEKAGVEGPVFGSNDLWKGVGVFLDSFDNDALQNNPIIAVMVNDGTKTYDHQHDGSGQIQGSCIRDFRNKPFPIRLKIEYVNQGLTIYLNNGITQDDNAFEYCTRIDGVQLPKTGYLGVTAATGGLADDHDVLEFMTTTYSDKQALAQNQAATDEQAKKYKEEYEKYEQELKKQQDDYKKEHPDMTTPYNEKNLYESEYDREFRTILEGQDQIRSSLTSIDKKMLELLGRVERLAVTTGTQQQIVGQGGSGVPADVARIQDVNRVINSNTDMTRTIQSYAQVLTDLQQKVNHIQTSINNQRPIGTGQQVVTPNIDGTVVNEIRELVRMIKSETNTLLQKSSTQVTCPTVTGGNNSSCVGTFTFIGAIIIQIVVLVGFFAFK
ncbi:unnamed protein product [Rotaria sp. Silwood1]|nr:unnamed protein product [Rotaria sp. Silwood1]